MARTLKFRRFRRYATPAILGLLLQCGPAGEVAADDTAPSQLDQALERALNDGSRRGDRQRSLSPEQLPRSMQVAADQLRSGDLTAARALQAEVLTALDRLLEQQQQRRSPQNDGAASPEQSALAGVGDAGPDERGTARGPGDGAARESDSQAGGGAATRTAVEHRRNLATSVWGHLPDRLREQMQQSYREQYLPGYEDLIDSYYEALAQPRDDEATSRRAPSPTDR